jgi:TPR repeat protein
MYTHSSALTTLFGLLNTLGTLISRFTDQQDTARKKGLELYNLGEFRSSEAYLTIAATAGDSESQYALAEVIRRREKSLDEKDKTHADKDWYALAAAQGDIYALLRLADEASLEQAKTLAQARADSGDGQAMLQLYEMTKDIAWLKKSAEANFLEGQYILAIVHDKDHTFIPDAVERRTTIDSWLKRAAEGGFSKAMHWYSNRPPISQDLPARREWVIKRAQLNDVNAVLEYGYGLGGVYEDEDGVDTEYGFEKDLIKGYGLIWLVLDTTREFWRYNEASNNLSGIAKDMSSADMEAGKAFAQEWKGTHPPMWECRLTYSDLK